MRKLLIVFLFLSFILTSCSQNSSKINDVVNLSTESPPEPTLEPTPSPEPEKFYSYIVKYCTKALYTVKVTLKDPSSLEVHKIVYDDTNNHKTVYIDFSAKNGFGGTDRKTFLVTDSKELISSGTPNLETFMYAAEDPFNGIMLQLKDALSKDEVNDVLELLIKYEDTQDKDLFN